MEVILLDNVEHLGNLGDRVRVRRGYARNFLIPKGRATEATAANVARFEERRAELEKKAAEMLSVAEARRAQLEQRSVTIVSKAGDEGKLFGSVGATEIAEAISASGAEVERREVRLPTGALRQLGEYKVVVHLHSDVDATVKISIVSE